MGFDTEVLNRAFNLKQKERDNAIVRFEKQSEEMKLAKPRLVDIENELGMIGAQIAVTTISGDSAKLSALRERAQKLTAEREEIIKEFNPLPQYECEKCKDTGYCDNKICECVLKKAEVIAYEDLCNTAPAEECTFQNFNLKYYDNEKTGDTSPYERMSKVLNKCKGYVSEVGSTDENLLFLGGTGLGKTHLSLAIAGQAVKKRMSVVYGSAQNLISKIANEQFSYSGETRVEDGVLGCDLLIIDDLGVEHNTSYSQTTVYNIINTRLLSKKQTVISTNLSLKEIGEMYTPRVLSRIIGGYSVLEFKGKDIRQKKLQEKLK